MARYDFRCSDVECKTLTELVKPMSDPLPETIPCQTCGKPTTYVPSAPAVLRTGMTNEPFDVAVGRNAEARWANIHERQAARDKVRREAGSVGLAATGFEEFKPISKGQRVVRTHAIDAVAKDGYKPQASEAIPDRPAEPSPKTK